MIFTSFDFSHMTWLQLIVSLRVQDFYVVHPTRSLKYWIFMLRLAIPEVYGKVEYIERLADLQSKIGEAVAVPQHVLDHDKALWGCSSPQRINVYLDASMDACRFSLCNQSLDESRSWCETILRSIEKLLSTAALVLGQLKLKPLGSQGMSQVKQNGRVRGYSITTIPTVCLLIKWSLPRKTLNC